MIKKDIIIIGGGASGLVAAVVAKDNGSDVLVIEGENRVAKKILVTGNGRCNFSNQKIKPPYKEYHSNDFQFYTSVLNQLTVENTVNLFYTYGLPLITFENNKMYPQSLQASSVVDILRLNINERDIPVYLNTKVINITKEKDGYLLKTLNEEYPLFKAKKLVIACGGSAAPNTGSDGSINQIMVKLGHSIIKPLPAIVQLKLNYKHLKAISGVRFDALASIIVNNKVKRIEYDEVLFTDYGISGPAILQISRYASTGLSNNDEVKITLDLFPKMSDTELKDFLEAQFVMFGHRKIVDALNGIINKKLLPIILKDSGITNIHKTCDQIDFKEKANLYYLLKNWVFECIETNGFKNAQTTIGGINTLEVNKDTLESKIHSGLFFSGEVLDVDGDCGGFNLQWAWSSGYVAGMNISKK